MGRHSPEHFNPQPQPETSERLTPEALEALNVKNIQSLRDAQEQLQQDIMGNVHSKYEEGNAVLQFADELDKMRGQFLEKYGITPQTEDYDTINDFLTNVSIDSLTDEGWSKDLVDPSTGDIVEFSGRTKAEDLQYMLQHKISLVDSTGAPQHSKIWGRLNPVNVQGPSSQSVDPNQTQHIPRHAIDSDETQQVSAPDKTQTVNTTRIPNANIVPPPDPDQTQWLPLFGGHNPNQQQPDPNQTQPIPASRVRSSFPNPNQPVQNPNTNQPNPNQQQNPNTLSAITPEMQKTFDDLNQARSELAHMSSRRQAALAGGESQEFKAARDKYNFLMQSYIADLYKWQGVDKLPHGQQNAFVTEHIIDQTRRLRGETNAIFDNTITMKLSRVVASVMNRFGIGTTSNLAVRAARDATAVGMQPSPLTREQEDAIKYVAFRSHDYGPTLDQANRQVEASIKGEQSTNRKAALVGGVAMFAAGFSLGNILHHFAGQTEHIGGVPEMSSDATDTVSGGSSGGHNVTEGLPHSGVTEAQEDMYINHHHLTPNQLAAFNVGKGEGGIELMHNLGHGATEWYNMQDDLLSLHPNDFYRMSDGNVGLLHPGRMSTAAVQDISLRLGIWQ